MNQYDLEDRLLRFAYKIIQISESLKPTISGKHIARQLLRSGTSPLANHGEAQASESLADFIHKMKICLKELRETNRWLKLIYMASLSSEKEALHALLQEVDELIRIFFSSIRKAQRQTLNVGVPCSKSPA